MLKVAVKMLDEREREGKALRRIKMLHHCSCALENRFKKLKELERTETWGIRSDNPQCFMSTLAIWDPLMGSAADEYAWRSIRSEFELTQMNSENETEKGSDAWDSDYGEGPWRYLTLTPRNTSKQNKDFILLLFESHRWSSPPSRLVR